MSSLCLPISAATSGYRHHRRNYHRETQIHNPRLVGLALRLAATSLIEPLTSSVRIVILEGLSVNRSTYEVEFYNGALNKVEYYNGALNKVKFYNGALNKVEYYNGALNKVEFYNGALNKVEYYNGALNKVEFYNGALNKVEYYNGALNKVEYNHCGTCNMRIDMKIAMLTKPSQFCLHGIVYESKYCKSCIGGTCNRRIDMLPKTSFKSLVPYSVEHMHRHVNHLEGYESTRIAPGIIK
ncbi:hypothetical protein Tco_0332864 [Tanacetum coccineum]